MFLNRKYYSLYLIAVIPLLFSCRTHFPEPEFDTLTSPPNKKKVFNDFIRQYPDKLSMEQSALITIGKKKIISIGVCRFDIKKDEIALLLVTTTGMKILELSRSNGTTKTHFAFPEITNKTNASEQLVKDIHNIYFQPLNYSGNAEINENRIIYKWNNKNIRTELVFGRTPQHKKIVLLIKKIFNGEILDSVVYYSDYQLKHGKNVPMTIHYENRTYDYSLILKTKKLYYDD